MQSCFEIADYFIELANQTGSPISPSKLQKLLYYSQAWHLALQGTPLFAEDFQAWIHGPVIPALFQKYQAWGWQPIHQDVKPSLPTEITSFLSEVVDEYFSCDPDELEAMTRAEVPWQKARGNLPADEPSRAMIEKAWMKEYYGSRGEENTEDPTEATSKYQLLV